jgi:Macrocin-O-methyltransferase (TylF)
LIYHIAVCPSISVARPPPFGAIRRTNDKCMGVGALLNRMLRPAGLQLDRIRTALPLNRTRRSALNETEDPTDFVETVYDQDGLRSVHNHEFRLRQRFQKAYQRGVRAVGEDYHWHWRVHVALWAAQAAALLDGDFIECGVNRGFMSSAIMDYLDWNELDRRFFLLDTFSGIDLRYVTEEERADGIAEKNAKSIASEFYTFDAEAVRRNFSEWSRVTIIPGSIPDTLPQIVAARIAFVHMDLNCSAPEVAAIRFLWDRLVPGALVVLDDYAYYGYRSQRIGMDQFARSVGIGVLSLPTGQGLLIKPPAD